MTYEDIIREFLACEELQYRAGLMKSWSDPEYQRIAQEWADRSIAVVLAAKDALGIN